MLLKVNETCPGKDYSNVYLVEILQLESIGIEVQAILMGELSASEAENYRMPRETICFLSTLWIRKVHILALQNSINNVIWHY